MKHISIIIIHYNTEAETLVCLDSITKIEPIKHVTVTTLVVDNGSKEPLKLPKKYAKLSIKVIRSEANLGFAEGNNVAIKTALDELQSDYTLLLNSDAILAPNTVRKLFEYAEKNPKAGLIAPKIYFTPGYEFHAESYPKQKIGKVLWFAGGVIDWNYLTAFHKGVDEVDIGQFNTITNEDFVTGCCMLVRKEVWEQIGLFNKQLFLYWEDVELSLRATQAGFEVVYLPNTYCWHNNGGSSDGAGSSTSIYYQTRNKLWMAWHYGNWKSKVLVIKEFFRFLATNHYIERLAVIDVLVGKMGKRTLF